MSFIGNSTLVFSMTNNTLYLVQSSYSHTQRSLEQLQHIANAEDSLVLMGDAVLCLNDATFQTELKTYILETDADILASAPPTHVQVLSYADFADLVLNFKRCVSLK